MILKLVVTIQFLFIKRSTKPNTWSPCVLWAIYYDNWIIGAVDDPWPVFTKAHYKEGWGGNREENWSCLDLVKVSLGHV